MRYGSPVSGGDAHAETASGSRSLAKAVTYRVIVMCADAVAIYLLTGQWRAAAGFMIASNIYTTVLYFLRERIWARIRWGRPAPLSLPVDERSLRA